MAIYSYGPTYAHVVVRLRVQVLYARVHACARAYVCMHARVCVCQCAKPRRSTSVNLQAPHTDQQSTSASQTVQSVLFHLWDACCRFFTANYVKCRSHSHRIVAVVQRPDESLVYLRLQWVYQLMSSWSVSFVVHIAGQE